MNKMQQFLKWLMETDPKLVTFVVKCKNSDINIWLQGQKEPSEEQIKSWSVFVAGKTEEQRKEDAARILKEQDPTSSESQPTESDTDKTQEVGEAPETGKKRGRPWPKKEPVKEIVEESTGSQLHALKDMIFNLAKSLVGFAKDKLQVLPWDVVQPLRDIFFPWEGKRLFIGFISYKYTNPATCWSLVQLALDLGKEKVRFDFDLGNARIYDARNKLANRFMKSECEWMLFIDDDMILPTAREGYFRWITRKPVKQYSNADGLHTVHRLVSHQKTLVGALYYGRNIQGQPMFKYKTEEEIARAKRQADGIIPTEWVGTGCMLIHRKVLEDIAASNPDLKRNDPSQEFEDDRQYFDFFLPMPGKGEDYSFCLRAAAAGHQPYVDTGLVCAHVGYNSWMNHNTGE